MMEKESRDRQLYEEKHRKKVEEKETYKQEVELVKRLQYEMDQERAMIQEKRK